MSSGWDRSSTAMTGLRCSKGLPWRAMHSTGPTRQSSMSTVSMGVDGSGENWEYTDGFSFRNAAVNTSNSTFTESEWTFGGANSLETGDDVTELALILANTTPGTHTFNAVPSPAGGAGLLSLAIFGAAIRRRRK